ncbi:hypothetical protein [Rhizobium leguminosarum]|uniref:hypothetical protein n=1 Tax=Rhizobium leguminosarum TaxID=384 RepID=UPI001FDEF229|nr:hypothetical protein [Rhizobium leguminosarum]
MQHIIMPPHIIIIGMPPDIIDIMRLQHSMNMSLSMPSIGFISQTMPSAVMLHFIEPIIIIIGMEAIIGIIAPFIMGMPPIIGIIPPPIIGFIMAGIMLFIIGIMFMAGFIVFLRSMLRVSCFDETGDKRPNRSKQCKKIFHYLFLQ